MEFRCTLLSITSATAIALGAVPACAQPYPSKPVRIVTGEPGGGLDLAARIVAQGITGGLGQQVIVENKPSGVIPGDTVAKAPADGYVLLVAASSFWIGSLLQETPYDPIRDFAPISVITKSPSILVVNPSFQVGTVKQLIDLAKARPGELNYSAAGKGGISHLSAELFKAMAGVNIVYVAYKGSSAALMDLIGGQVQLSFPSAAAAAPHVRSAKLKALAVTGAQPSALIPGVPTIAASGLPGYETLQMSGVLAQAKLSPAIVTRLNQEIARFLGSPQAKDKLLSSGEEASASSPQEFAATIKAEMSKFGKVIRDAGI